MITITDRLDTILDSDRILLLHYGEVVEFDSPSNLLGRASRFKAFYEAVGCQYIYENSSVVSLYPEEFWCKRSTHFGDL